MDYEPQMYERSHDEVSVPVSDNDKKLSYADFIAKFAEIESEIIKKINDKELANKVIEYTTHVRVTIDVYGYNDNKDFGELTDISQNLLNKLTELCNQISDDNVDNIVDKIIDECSKFAEKVVYGDLDFEDNALKIVSELTKEDDKNITSLKKYLLEKVPDWLRDILIKHIDISKSKFCLSDGRCGEKLEIKAPKDYTHLNHFLVSLLKSANEQKFEITDLKYGSETNFVMYIDFVDEPQERSLLLILTESGYGEGLFRLSEVEYQRFDDNYCVIIKFA